MSKVSVKHEVTIELEDSERECLHRADKLIRSIQSDLEDQGGEYIDELDIVRAAADAMYELLDWIPNY